MILIPDERDDEEITANPNRSVISLSDGKLYVMHNQLRHAGMEIMSRRNLGDLPISLYSTSSHQSSYARAILNLMTP